MCVCEGVRSTTVNRKRATVQEREREGEGAVNFLSFQREIKTERESKRERGI
jgi:hypothetical protein